METFTRLRKPHADNGCAMNRQSSCVLSTDKKIIRTKHRSPSSLSASKKEIFTFRFDFVIHFLVAFQLLGEVKVIFYRRQQFCQLHDDQRQEADQERGEAWDEQSAWRQVSDSRGYENRALFKVHHIHSRHQTTSPPHIASTKEKNESHVCKCVGLTTQECYQQLWATSLVVGIDKAIYYTSSLSIKKKLQLDNPFDVLVACEFFDRCQTCFCWRSDKNSQPTNYKHEH